MWWIGCTSDASRENATLSLTGLGLCMPIISAVIAFANLFGMGGAPLCSIARGKGDQKEAERIMGNAFSMLLITGVILTVIGLLFKKPLLYAFGASDATYPYANSYLTIYLLGTIFVMTSLGLNAYINAQGFARIGMMTTLIGAVLNIILDPVFIFIFDMGVQGAAIATVISQAASAAWTFRFLTGNGTILRIRLSSMKPHGKTIGQITSLGLSGFMMSITNSIVQVVCNSTLSACGGDLYVGVMTVVNSIREIVTMPVTGVTNGSQPVISFNYGAGKYDRIKKAIRFMSISCIVYTVAIWGILHLFPVFFIHIFNNQPDLVEAAVPSMQIYYFGFFMMSLQFSGQDRLPGTRQGEVRHFLLHSEKSGHRHASDPAASQSGYARGQRRLPGGARLQLHRRRGLLHYHAGCGRQRAGQPAEKEGKNSLRKALSLLFGNPLPYTADADLRQPCDFFHGGAICKEGKRHFPFCF